MNDWRTTVLDDPSMWPKEPIVALEEPHSDGRGAIQSLVNFPTKNISLIKSKKGILRSNHYHHSVQAKYRLIVDNALFPELAKLLADENAPRSELPAITHVDYSARVQIVWGTAVPKTLRGLYRLWMKFGLLLSKVTTPIILGTAFALLIVPYAAALKLLGRDPMRRKLEKSDASYRIKASATKEGHMKRPF
jgi:hypothetical protein